MNAEQRLAAKVMLIVSRVGMVILVAAFAAYVLGLAKPSVPPERLPHVWGLGVDEYARATGAVCGWGWVNRLTCGDYMNFLGIAVLAATSFAGSLALAVAYLRRRDRVYAVIAAAQAVVLAVAASGVLVE